MSRLSPVFARTINDGVYLRALAGTLWLLIPMLGVGVGLAMSISTSGNVLVPALPLLLALLVVGILDAFAGALAVTVFSLVVFSQGGFTSSDSIRGFLGLFVFGFGVSLVAAATRPFRRVHSPSITRWDRVCDVVLLPLFGAWAAGSMFSALPGLTGYSPDFMDQTTLIQVVAAVALLTRIVIESAAQKLVSGRLRTLEATDLPEPPRGRKTTSILLRTSVFVFVASVFIGNEWGLWVGGLMYMIPKMVSLFDEKFPNLEIMYRYLPRGIFKFVLMLFVARWWGTLLTNAVEDPEQLLQYGFVFSGIPGLALTSIAWFARDGKKWPSTWFTKITGTILLVVGFLTVQGFIF